MNNQRFILYVDQMLFFVLLILYAPKKCYMCGKRKKMAASKRNIGAVIDSCTRQYLYICD